MQNFKRRNFTKILISLTLLFPLIKINLKRKKRHNKIQVVKKFSKVWFIKDNDNS